MKEIWKDIKGYKGYYMVSNLGRVKSLGRVIIYKSGKKIALKDKILKQTPDKYGYLMVGLNKNNIQKKCRVHQLVSITFLNHKLDGTNKLCTDHKNNIKSDNRLDNLQIITIRENSTKDKNNVTSEHPGVCLLYDNKYQASITIDGKSKYLGRFDSELDAAQAYQYALKELL